ncbi:unnamed protein product [Peronospora belbahrii]|uniref:Mitochondrial resolvase Ydc2 catalytic domain-containing protein n=2 Tax=Peronospora belbahrii TaxID=622444 RepID=A0ABN8CNW6_9STRA|nr:unnamed protein product [Peronospora belbahrii]
MRKDVKASSIAIRRNGVRIRKALEVCNLAKHSQHLVRNALPLRVLGLDVNTNSTGFAIVTERGLVCRWGHIPTAQFASDDVLRIGGAVDDYLATVQDAEQQQQPSARWVVGIEAYLRMFRSGRFHNAGIFQLAQLNGIVSFSCWKRFNVLPLHTHPSAARGYFGLSTASGSSGKKSNIKHQVMQFFEQQEPEVARKAEIAGQHAEGLEALPRLKRMRSGALADSAFDVADAYVIAAYTRCAYLQKQLEIQHPQLVKYFSARYLELTYEAAAKTKKSSKEMTILKAMDEKEVFAYTRELFAFGLENWFKDHNKCFMLYDGKS